jgi:ArsR family transcriptional regulator, cadmium/lead-responsive transcriptional repressor
VLVVIFSRRGVHSCRPELLELFAAAEAVLDATGNAVASCPNDGAPVEGPVRRA